MFEFYHCCGLKYSVELRVYLQDIPVYIQSFRYVRTVLLYVIDSGIHFLLFFSLLLNSSFLSVLSTILICSSRTSFLYCRSRNFCLMKAQFLSNSVVVEQIAFSLKILPFRDLGCSDLACKNACLSVSLRCNFFWVLLFSSL